MKQNEKHDIIVNLGLKRQIGLCGRVIKNGRVGVSAVLENGERTFLKNRQFDYLTELEFQKNSSQFKKNV